MATIKSYTDIEQSKKLAEILPIDSADMLHCIDFDGDLLFTVPIQYSGSYRYQPELTIPCWSLTSLFAVLPNGIIMNKDSQNDRYHFSSTRIGTYIIADNPIDACYDMILNDVNFPTPEGFERKDMIAWLEKHLKASKVEEAMREVEKKSKLFTELHKGETSEEILAQMKGEKGVVLRDTFGYEKGREKGREEGVMLVLDNPRKYGLEKGLRNLANSAKTCKDEQTPAWSEEDSMVIKILRTMIAAYVKDDEERKKLVRWLDIHCNAYPIPSKLLQAWKPSEEQMEALDDFIYAKYPNIEKYGAAVKSLYQDLKKLRKG